MSAQTSSPPLDPAIKERISPEAAALHRDALVIEGHNQLMMDYFRRHDRGERNIFDAYWAPRLQAGGVNVVELVVGANSPCLAYMTDHILWGMLTQIDMLEEEQKTAKSFRICRSTAEIKSAVAEGRIALLLKVESSRAMDGNPQELNLSLLRTLYRLGLRTVDLVSSGRTMVADGIGEARADARLTTFGVQVIREMERLGMLVDTCQMPDHVFYDALEIVSKPVIDSHSNVFALSSHPRNLKDERIKALAATGGAMGLCFLKEYIRRGAMNKNNATIDHLIDHIDHIANLVGSMDHIFLGPDVDEFDTVRNIFNCWSPYPGSIEGIKTGIPDKGIIMDDLRPIENLPLITDAMLRRGYKQQDVRKLLGGNLMRIYEQTMG